MRVKELMMYYVRMVSGIHAQQMLAIIIGSFIAQTIEETIFNYGSAIFCHKPHTYLSKLSLVSSFIFDSGVSVLQLRKQNFKK